MGYKLKTGKTYDNCIGQDLAAPYAWIDTVIIESRAKRANIILKVTANQQASVDMRKPLEVLSFIVENKTEEVDGETVEVNDFDTYIEDILKAITPSSNLKKKAYTFLNDKNQGKKVGFFTFDDWESDEEQ